MGRPTSKRYFGNIALAGQQIRATAWLPGQGAAFDDAFIVKQTGSNKFIMRANAGVASGRVVLVRGALTGPGQANIEVSPWGSSGSGATVVANLGVTGVTIVTRGNGPVTSNYKPGDVLSLVGGTRTKLGNVLVNSVNIGNATVQTPGTGYTVNSYVLFSGPGWLTPGNVRITGINGSGNITSISTTDITGVYVGTTLPTNPITPTSGVGTGATFNFRFDVATVAVVEPGAYSAIPANPVTLSTSGSGGDQANVAATWGLSEVSVTSGGSGYRAVKIVPESGTAVVFGTVNAQGNVTTASIETAGTYVGRPNVTVSPRSTKLNASALNDNTVETFPNSTKYKWKMTGVQLTDPTQASVRSS